MTAKTAATPRSSDYDRDDTNARLSSLEAHQDHFGNLLARVADDVSSGFRRIDQRLEQRDQTLRGEFETLYRHVDSRTKSQPSIVLQLIAVIMGVAGLAFAVFAGWITMNEAQRRRDDDQVGHRMEWIMQEMLDHHEDGHPKVVIEKVNSNADRITRLSDRTEERLRAIESQRVSDQDDAQDERLRALERAAFGDGGA